MSVKTLNPNNATAQAVADHWAKIATLLVNKAGGHVVITLDDFDHMQDGLFITVQELGDGLHLRLVDEATAHRLAREHGGLPT